MPWHRWARAGACPATAEKACVLNGLRAHEWQRVFRMPLQQKRTAKRALPAGSTLPRGLYPAHNAWNCREGRRSGPLLAGRRLAAASRYYHEGQRTAKSVKLECPSPQDAVNAPRGIGADVTGVDVTGAGAICAGVAWAGVGRAVSVGVCAFGFRAGRCDSSGASKRTVIPSLPRNQQRRPSTLLMR